ncbi:MAG: flagellar cap protein FliD N-terminal domain-containing protein, partial [Candidatus Adiutrix sp.]
MSSVSNTISGQIKWTGLASGTDFKVVVDQLVAIEQRTITRQETWKSQWQEKLTVINNLDTRLGSLRMNAQDYDTRDKFLSRKALSSNPEVASITNTSTAAVGTYKVEVGRDIQEKIASRSFKSTESIGANNNKNANGEPIDLEGNIIGTSNFGDDNILEMLRLRVPGSGTVTYDPVEKQYLDKDNVVIATVNASNEIILASDSTTVLADMNSDGFIVSKRDDSVIPSSDPNDFIKGPISITMGGKTLTLLYDETAAAGDVGKYNGDFTMDDLVATIKATLDSDPDEMPNISVEIMFDKTRREDGADVTYNRLVITGGDGGLANHIIVSDHSNLCLDRTAIEAPVTNAWVGSNSRPYVSDDSFYTGHVN